MVTANGVHVMFDWVQVRALTGPFKEIHRVVPKPLLHCLGCVLRVIVLLSEVLSALDQVFMKDIYVLGSIQLSLTLTSPPVPAAEKQPHSMMLPPPCFTVGMVLCR